MVRSAPRRRGPRWISCITVVAATFALTQAVTLTAAPHGSPASADASTGSGGQFVPVQGRILDTRPGSSFGGYSTPMPSNTWRSVPVDGQFGIPTTGVAAVAVDITVVVPASSGSLKADKDEATPNSTVTYVSYVAGPNQSNAAVIAVGTDGEIQAMATSSTNLIIDVQGYYTAGDPDAGGYVPVTPTRLVDTRNGTGLPQAQLTSGSTTTIQVSGNADVPSDATAVVVNLTIANQSGSGGITPYPADQVKPGTRIYFSSPNEDSNGGQVGLSGNDTPGVPEGAFDVYLQGPTADIVVDVVGYFTASEDQGSFTPGAARVYDSRVSPHTRIAGGATTAIQVTGVAGAPVMSTGLAAVAIDITVLNNAGTLSGSVNVWADGTTEPSPGASIIYHIGSTTSNMVTTALGTDGAVDVRNHGAGATDFVIDVEGWYSASITTAPVTATASYTNSDGTPYMPTSDADADAFLQNFWTSDRVAAATANSMDYATADSSVDDASDARLDGPEVDMTADTSSSIDSSPAVDSTSVTSDGTYSPDAANASNIKRNAASGQVNFRLFNGDLSSCTASVINTGSKSILLTAAHCLHSGNVGICCTGFYTDFQFFPWATSGGFKLGYWRGISGSVTGQWAEYGGPNYNKGTMFAARYDYGMLYLAKGGTQTPKRTIQSVVGANGWATNAATSYSAVTFGFPENVQQGFVISACSGSASKWTYDLSLSWLGCRWGPGASGGPWLANYSNSTGYGQVRAVTSITDKEPGPYLTIRGARFGAEFTKMISELTP